MSRTLPRGISKEKHVENLLNAINPSFAVQAKKVFAMDKHFPLTVLKEHAERGSSTAANLVKAKKHWLKAVSYIDSSSNKYQRDAINQLFSCLNLPNGEIVCAFNQELYLNFRKAAARLFAENPLDGKIFFVLTFVRSLSEGLLTHIEAVKYFLEKSNDREAELTRLLGIMYQFRGTQGNNADIKLCVKYLTKAMELFGDKVSINMYYLRGSNARLLDKTVNLAIRDYRYFLENAPIDERCYPEACYELALTLGHKRYKYAESREMYEKGLNAELSRLPFFGPIKDTIKNLIAVDPWITKPISKSRATRTPAREKEAKFSKGAKVKLQGLKVKEYNGKVGTVVGSRVNAGGVFRYPVELEAGSRPKNVKPENLLLVE